MKVNPALSALRHHVTGAVERGEKKPIIAQFQLIPEEELPFNLVGQTLPPEPPQETTNTETQPDLIP